eukprot:365255-Chlamydomonas_euryale.AAC.26
MASCHAVTVQDFLERYEVGETVGVGGERRGSACEDGGSGVRLRSREEGQRQDDRRASGDQGAARLRVGGAAACYCLDVSIASRMLWHTQVVDKSRYAAGDNSLEREIKVLIKVDHPNCIRLFDVYITPRKVYLVTELVTGGELLDRVTEKGNYTEKDAANLIRQILEGVAYLHSQGIVHRDLKVGQAGMPWARITA